MANNAVQLTDDFHEDVKRVSKPKTQGEIVRRLQTLFEPIVKIRTGKPEITISVSGRVMAQDTAKRAIKHVVKKKKKK